MEGLLPCLGFIIFGYLSFICLQSDDNEINYTPSQKEEKREWDRMRSKYGGNWRNLR